MTQAQRTEAIAANIEAAERFERLQLQKDADIAWEQAAALMSMPVLAEAIGATLADCYSRSLEHRECEGCGTNTADRITGRCSECAGETPPVSLLAWQLLRSVPPIEVFWAQQEITW